MHGDRREAECDVLTWHCTVRKNIETDLRDCAETAECNHMHSIISTWIIYQYYADADPALLVHF